MDVKFLLSTEQRRREELFSVTLFRKIRIDSEASQMQRRVLEHQYHGRVYVQEVFAVENVYRPEIPLDVHYWNTTAQKRTAL
mmetsp:Transcript_5014/g.7044  ORF Transcript_5014/g.7044 Transcript_5014/m.7044 type:complete len:82 (+) Transcript_5014:30-275(+)